MVTGGWGGRPHRRACLLVPLQRKVAADLMSMTAQLETGERRPARTSSGGLTRARASHVSPAPSVVRGACGRDSGPVMHAAPVSFGRTCLNGAVASGSAASRRRSLRVTVAPSGPTAARPTEMGRMARLGRSPSDRTEDLRRPALEIAQRDSRVDELLEPLAGVLATYGGDVSAARAVPRRSPGMGVACGGRTASIRWRHGARADRGQWVRRPLARLPRGDDRAAAAAAARRSGAGLAGEPSGPAILALDRSFTGSPGRA